ncbi:hypothetical protein I7331_05150, partial [Frankia sp. AgB1.8]|nr:hypothetical protein [Frankia sp. AgB1.8]
MTTEVRGPSEWIIHGERVVDDTRRAVLSIADVELPDGVRFEQYVLRLPRAAVVGGGGGARGGGGGGGGPPRRAPEG